MTAAGAANCKINYNELDKGGEVNMISVFEETRTEGVAEGRTQGRTEGQSLLIKAVQLIRAGYTEKELLEQGIDQNTIRLAMTIK